MSLPDSRKVCLVDVVLHDGRPDHRGGTGEETHSHLLDWRKAESRTFKGRVHEAVADRNKDDKRERIEVVEHIIRQSMGGHCRSLRSQVVVNLIIREP